MFWIIGFGLTGIVLAAIETITYFHTNIWLCVFLLVIFVIIGAVTGVLVGWFIAWLCSFFVRYGEGGDIIDLVSLDEYSNSDKRFFLKRKGSCYFYRQDFGDGEFHPIECISTEDATVDIDESDGPADGHAIITYDTPIGNIFIINLLTSAIDKNFKYDFLVPAGSVKE